MKEQDKLPEKKEGLADTGVEILLEVIGYAGLPLTTIYTNYRNKERADKINAALKEVAREIKVFGAVLEKLLTRDQVCELIERHVPAIAITSDEEKLQCLKNSLKKAFTEDRPFNEKEFYFTLLQNLSPYEITVLMELYMEEDPLVKRVYPRKDLFGTSSYHIPRIERKLNGAFHYGPYEHNPEYKEGVGMLRERNEHSLEKYFKAKYKEKWSFVKSACMRLDSLGLTNVKDNLGKYVFLEIKMIDVNEPPSLLNSTIDHYHEIHEDGFPIHDFENEGTSFQRCKTDSGADFVKYIME
jgi:hypothetical protein